MHTEPVAALVRSHKRVMRCEQHLAEIHERLQATSLALAKSRQLLRAGDGEALLPWRGTPCEGRPMGTNSRVSDEV